MKKNLHFKLMIALLAISGWGFAQSTIDFETVGNSWTWSTFENNNISNAFTVVANPSATGINTSATCGKIVVDAAGQPYAGTECKHGDFGPYLWSSSSYVVKFMVYKSIISPIGLKFATSTGWAKDPIKVSNTLINQWEEITVDFSAYMSDPQPAPFDQIIIFPDWPSSRTAGSINYIDNISFPGAPPVTLQVSTGSLTVAASAGSTNSFDITTALGWTLASDQTWLTPSSTTGTGNATITLTAEANTALTNRIANVTVTASDLSAKTVVVTQSGATLILPDAPTPGVAAEGVKSIYSDAYTPVAATFDNWYGTTMTEQSSTTPANKVKKVVSACCFGYNFVSAMDLSSMTALHVDIYPTTAASMKIGIVASGEHKVLKTVTANTWNSIDITLLDLTTAANLASVTQVGFWEINGEFYMDNLYFYNPSVGISKLDQSGISFYPNPVKSSLHMDGLPQNATVKIFDNTGKLLVNKKNAGREIDVNNLSKGVYIIQVTDKNGITTKKFVKE